MQKCKRCGNKVESTESACNFCGEIIDNHSWIEVITSDDVESLLTTFGWFHDSCIKELHMWSRHFVYPDLSMQTSGDLDHNVRVLFQRQEKCPSAIEMRFEEVTGLHVDPAPYNYDSIIYEASFVLEDGVFYWANVEEWGPDDREGQVTWISAKKVKWRDASSWMGAELRYGARE